MKKQQSNKVTNKIMIDEIQTKLRCSLNKKNGDECFLLSSDMIVDLCNQTKTTISEQDSMLLRLEAPINICEDIHDQFSDLLNLMKQIDQNNHLFLE